ncbi:MAG: rhamnogalacturonase, partial [Herbinix sp.]|nr:rhamnogalacturonase [Herbinix sp.]
MPLDREEIINDKLNRLITSFQKVLYEEDDTFLYNMKANNLAGDDISKYQYWEWTQGIGLFGLWKLFDRTREIKYLDLLIKYYSERIETGLPSKNINTCAPMLALSYIAEYTNNNSYISLCYEWAQWIMKELPRTREG